MTPIILTCLSLILPPFMESPKAAHYNDTAFEVKQASVTYHPDLELVVFAMEVTGKAASRVPDAAGSLNGAPVLGYVFPTNLSPRDVGFKIDGGLVALAVTSHPDFDDTPLWDESIDGNYANDGAIYHPHWVVLHKDQRAPAGLAVKPISKEAMGRVLPPTNPGMPMLMDSPGFQVIAHGSTLKVVVPAYRMNRRTSLKFDAVTAYMEVSTDPTQPMLSVHKVYKILSGDLSLPYQSR